MAATNSVDLGSPGPSCHGFTFYIYIYIYIKVKMVRSETISQISLRIIILCKLSRFASFKIQN